MPFAHIEFNASAQKEINEWRARCMKHISLIEPKPSLKIEKIEPTVGIDEYEIVIWIGLEK